MMDCSASHHDEYVIRSSVYRLITSDAPQPEADIASFPRDTMIPVISFITVPRGWSSFSFDLEAAFPGELEAVQRLAIAVDLDIERDDIVLQFRPAQRRTARARVAYRRPARPDPVVIDLYRDVDA